MSIFAIGDLHLPFGCPKNMNVFPGWGHYVERLEASWRARIRAGDTVVLAGDFSWAMDMDEALPDFRFLEGLPGRKILLRGNHDYWWSTMTSMRRFLEERDLRSVAFLHNNSVVADGTALCGSRGWLFEPGERAECRVTLREAGRIRRSLEAAPPGLEKILFLHYPPVYRNQVIPEFFALMGEFGVRECYYGHLHGDSIPFAFEGVRNGVSCRLISADHLSFAPLAVRESP